MLDSATSNLAAPSNARTTFWYFGIRLLNRQHISPSNQIILMSVDFSCSSNSGVCFFLRHRKGHDDEIKLRWLKAQAICTAKTDKSGQSISMFSRRRQKHICDFVRWGHGLNGCDAPTIMKTTPAKSALLTENRLIALQWCLLGGDLVSTGATKQRRAYRGLATS